MSNGTNQPSGQERTLASPPAGIPPASFDLSRLTRADKIVSVASLVALISIWLPWFTASDGLGGYAAESGTSAHGGWMYLEFILALALIAYLAAGAAWDRRRLALPVAHAPLLIAGTGVQLVIMLIAFIDQPSGYAGAGITVGWDWGAFIGLAAAAVAAGPVLYPAIRLYLDSRSAAGPKAE
jgi:hypothetical protein